MEWAKNNWLKILIGIVVLIIIFLAVSSINNMLNCTSPICKGLGGVLGLPAKVINTVLSGCTTQSDCTQFKDSDSCGNGNGCSWSTSSTAGTCVCSTGLQTGDGGFFSSKCLLGMGAISFFAALAFSFIARIILKVIPSKSDNVKETVDKTGKTSGEVVQENAEESRALSTEGVDKLTDKSDITVETMASKITIGVIFRRLVNAIKGTRGTPADLAKQESDGVTIAANEDATVEEEAKSNGATEEQITDANDVADNAVPTESTISAIQSFQSINRVPSKNAHALLTRHVYHHLRKGEHIPSHHLVFLKSVEPK